MTATQRRRSRSPRVQKTCYVSIPYGRKRSAYHPHDIDFDVLYFDTIKPAVERAGYVCYRGDEPELGGIIQRSMIRLVADSDVMIADITCASPNVLYQIGLRHALRRRTTILIGAVWERIPYDVSHFTRVPYEMAGEQPSTDEQQRLTETLIRTIERRTQSTVTDSLVHDGQVLASGGSFTELLALPPQHLRYETKLGQFRREASFEKSVFIMTKFPEGKTKKDAQLSRVITTVRQSIASAGFVPRIASERCGSSGTRTARRRSGSRRNRGCRSRSRTCGPDRSPVARWASRTPRSTRNVDRGTPRRSGSSGPS